MLTAVALALISLTGDVTLSATPDMRTIESEVGRRLVIESKLKVPSGYSVGIRDWDLERPAEGQEFNDGEKFAVWALPKKDGSPYRLEHEVYIRKTETIETKDGKTIEVVVAGTERKLIEVVWISIKGDLPPPQKPPETPVDAKADRVTYVYEREEGGVPRPISAKFRELSESGITANAVDIDTVNGLGQTPEQYKVAFAAARGKLPAIVVQAGDKVIRVVEKPQTAKDVEEAIK